MGFGIKNKALKLKRLLTHWFANHFQRPQLFNLSSQERFGVIFHEPSDMVVCDRVMMYALVRGLKPQRALEIGVRWGGSARIITNAMEENGIGQLVGIDPQPENFQAQPKELHDRYQLLCGYSPDEIKEAARRVGGKFDFVFIDGMHTHDAVLADLQGVLPYLEAGAYVLLHDAYHQGIGEAVNHVLRDTSDLFDCGILTRNPDIKEPVSYQGLRLLRYGAVNIQQLIVEAYQESGFATPQFSEELWNFDRGLLNRKAQAAELGIKLDDKGRQIIEPSASAPIKPL